VAGRQGCVSDVERAGILMTDPVWPVMALIGVGLLGVTALLAWVAMQD